MAILKFCGKKSLKLSPTNFRIYFLGLFFLFQYDFIQKSLRKKSSYTEKCMRTKYVYNHGKKGMDSWLYSICRLQMHRSKFLFMKSSQTWPHFRKTYNFFLDFFLRIYFLQDLNSRDLISWDFIGSPHIILGKKVPGI